MLQVPVAGTGSDFDMRRGAARLCRMSVIQSDTHTHTPFNGSFSGTTQVSRYQKGKTNLDFTQARGSEWQWHQLGHMQVYISLQTDNHASTPPQVFLQTGCPSCRLTNSVKALKAVRQADIDRFLQQATMHTNMVCNRPGA